MPTNITNRNAEIRTKSGKRVGTFRSLEDAQQYIADNNLEQVFQEPELAGITVTARRPRSFREHLAEGAANFEETFGLTPKDAAGFLPIVGDAIDLTDIGTDLYKGNYTNAAIGAGLFLLPNVIEKPAKWIKRSINTYRRAPNKSLARHAIKQDIRHFGETAKAVIDGRYIPAMTFGQKRNYLREAQQRYLDEVVPAAKTRYKTNRIALAKDFDIRGIPEEVLFPPTRFVSILRGRKQYGYNFNTNGINRGYDAVMSPNTSHHFNVLNPINETLGVASHELNHTSQTLLRNDQMLDINDEYKERLIENAKENGISLSKDDLFLAYREPIVDLDKESGIKTHKEYFGIPNYSVDKPRFSTIGSSDIFVETESQFNPLAKRNNNHSWLSSPNEVISETAKYIDYYTKGNRGKTFNELSLEDKHKVTELIAKRFNLTKHEAAAMLFKSSPRYLKYGGHITLSSDY